MRRKFRVFATVAAFCVAVFAVSVTHAAKRVALVIGNDTYETLPALNNARTDAKGMAAKLRSLGFDVILKLDARRREFGRTLAEFEGKAANAEVALVFYAGHGIQAGGSNYLVPSDAEIEVEEDLAFEGVESGAFLKAMKNAGANLNIVILDACRDNPLPKRSRSAARGLTVTPTPVGISGTAIVYSAAPGQTAQDGPKGGHGVFTGELLKVLDRPGLKLEDVFKETAKQVAAATNGKQKPWINSSLTGDFYFRDGDAKGGAPAPAPTGQTAEMLFWQSIKDSNDLASYQAYLDQYPSGVFAGLAQLRMKKLKGRQTAALTPTAFEVEEIDASYVALKTANVRAEPSTSSAKVGLLGRDSGISVTGKVAGGKWLRVEQADGKSGYVFGTLLAPADAGEVAAWAAVKDTKKADEVGLFLRHYPSGHFAARAKQLKAALMPQVAAVTPPKVTVPSPAKPAVGVYPKRYKAGDTFKDCDDCPEMVVIPPGSFRMGDLSGDGGEDEKPVREVRIGYSFAAGKYEVTRGEYAAFVNATGRGKGDGCYYYTGSKWEKGSDKSWRNPGFSQTDRDPVTCVNWDDAKAYVSWLSRKTGKTYRLLSEAEWEYVARAGGSSKYSYGNDESALCAHGNGADQRTSFSWKNTSCDDGYGNRTAPVGSFAANSFGLYDMHGNVLEWVEDCWHDSYHGAPSDGSAWVSGGDCSRRVLRGGSWLSKPWLLRSANRYRLGTVVRYDFIGFRVSRTVSR